MATNNQFDRSQKSSATSAIPETRVDVDASRPPANQQINALPQLKAPPIGSSFRLDVSALDVGDKLVDDGWLEREKKFRRLVFPNVPEAGKREPSRKADIDHLLGHLDSGNDIFVTRDKAILNVQVQLAQEFGLIVMSPEDALLSINLDLNEPKTDP